MTCEQISPECMPIKCVPRTTYEYVERCQYENLCRKDLSSQGLPETQTPEHQDFFAPYIGPHNPSFSAYEPLQRPEDEIRQRMCIDGDRQCTYTPPPQYPISQTEALRQKQAVEIITQQGMI